MPFIANQGTGKGPGCEVLCQDVFRSRLCDPEGRDDLLLSTSADPKSEVGGQRTEAGGRKSEDRSQSTADNRQRSEVRSQKSEGFVLKEILVGAKIADLKGAEPSQAKVNYFIGNDKTKWRTNIPTFNKVSLGEVYEGIDLSLKAYGKNVEKIFTVQPGADPKSIKLKMAGAKSLKINDKGELEAETGHGPVKFSKPVAYQEKDGKRENVQVAYHIDNDTYGFNAGDYDQPLPLIIDPALVYSTYLGGSGEDYGTSHCSRCRRKRLCYGRGCFGISCQ